MDLSSHREEFSYAYVHAIAAAVGYSCEKSPRLLDLDGIDLTIRASGNYRVRKRSILDLQVKCTSDFKILKKDGIKFPLLVHNYEDLISEINTIPCILVVVIIPENVDEWLIHSPDELRLRRCGYWKSLKGAPPTSNRKTITIDIPYRNQFTPNALKALILGQ